MEKDGEDDLTAIGRWRLATKELFVEFAEQLFGYALLVREDDTIAKPISEQPASNQARPVEEKMKFSRGSPSFTLMADWELVEGYYEFVQARVGRTYYTMSELNRTKTLLSLDKVVVSPAGNGVRRTSALAQKPDGRGAPHWAAGPSKPCEADFRELNRGTLFRIKWEEELRSKFFCPATRMPSLWS